MTYRFNTKQASHIQLKNTKNLCDYAPYVSQSIPGVPVIKKNYNPATWMLEITMGSIEEQLGLDFAQVYKESQLYK